MAVPLGGTGLTYAASTFFAMVFETVFYGIFLYIFIISTLVLYRNRPGSQTSLANMNLRLLSVSSLMFILGTIHLAIDVYRAMQSFIYYPGGPMAYLLATGTKQPIYVLKNVLFTLQSFLADGFLIYRVYKVWGSNRRMSLPFVLCFFGSIVTGIGTLVTQTQRKPSQSLFSGALHDWPLAFYIMTFLVNVGCTALIAYRIWAVNRETKILDVGTLLPVAVIVIESGAIYSTCVVILLVLYMNNSGAYKIVQDMLMQIIGLVFCGIIASVGLGTSDPTRPSNMSSIASGMVFRTRDIGADSVAESDPETIHELTDLVKDRG
ncbi:hypothetical protein B0H13DRAFT_2060658 [Mycena leptocephala]|nr:hypothetical protein B0H13DRAFT_2060658 [Mycena leptocephala]